jgi:hypothetical protein
MAKNKAKKKLKLEAEETVVGHPDDVLINHEFEQSLENAFAEKAVVVLTLDRRTGRVHADMMLSNPLEAWAICSQAMANLSTAALGFCDRVRQAVNPSGRRWWRH